MPGRSRAEQIFNIKSVLKLKASINTPAICTCVNFKKAYDLVDRKALFNVFETMAKRETTEANEGNANRYKIQSEIYRRNLRRI